MLKKVNEKNNATIQLREEKMDISKKKVKTGEVNIYKKSIVEEKTIIVPVIREELLIEKKFFSEDNPADENGNVETIRIPIKEEQVEIIKHPVNIENINIYKKQFKVNKQIKMKLKKEKEHIEIKNKP